MLETNIKGTRPLSPITITALAEVISGEARGKDGFPLGRYVRSARQIQQFLMEFGIDFSDQFPRLPKLRRKLEESLNSTSAENLCQEIIEGALNSKFAQEASVDYLNKFLRADGLEVRKHGEEFKVYPLKELTPLPQKQLEAGRPKVLSRRYRKEYGPDFGWLMNALLLPIVLPLLFVKFLLMQLFKVLGEVVALAFKYLKIVFAALIVLVVLVYFIQPSVPTALFEHLFDSPILKLFPSAL